MVAVELAFVWVHPRLRGERVVVLAATRALVGSSPLTRGAFVLVVDRGLLAGFIPARAGSIASPTAWTASPRVHPRSRGEHWHPGLVARRMQGSPPLTRGAPLRRAGRCPCLRFIPARAGSISVVISAATLLVGSSPLARGV